MVKVISDRGQGRTFILVHEQGNYGDFIQHAFEALSKKVRVVVLESELITDRNWAQSAQALSEKLSELGVRQGALVGFAGAAALVQQLVLTTPKIVRSLILVDATFRPHPSLATRMLDWFEGILPLGLPLRSREQGFDSKPFAQRIRCPVLIVLSQKVSTFIKSQAHEMSLRIPSAWIAALDRNDQVPQFCELLDAFEGVPVKCPQKKNRAAA